MENGEVDASIFSDIWAYGMVQDGITGVKFTYNSAEDLADKISAFDAMDLSVLKKNARAFYAERLRPEDNYQKLIRIYEDISK